MRQLLALGLMASLSTCAAARVRASGPAPGAVVEALLTYAATDFHAHRPPDPQRFRDVRVAHLPGAGGPRLYRLCGEFLPREGSAPAWTPFATIQTDPYEHWLGAAGFCTDPELVWDEVGDLSPALQARLDALR